MNHNQVSLYIATPNNAQHKEAYRYNGIVDYHYTNGAGTEYELFKEINQKENPIGPWGLVSSKFNLKSSIDINEFHEFATEKFARGTDCAFINPMILNESLFSNVWEQGVIVGHKGIDQIINFLIKKNNLKIKTISKEDFSFCNYFIASRNFWEHYFCFIDTLLSQLDDQVKLRSDVGIVYSGSAGYHKNQNMSMKPFVVERLLSLFITTCEQQNKFNFSKFEQLEEHYIKKAGFHYGNLLYNLKCAKDMSHSDEKTLNLWNSVRFEIMKNQSIFHGLLHLDDPDFKLIDSSNTIKIHLKNIAS